MSQGKSGFEIRAELLNLAQNRVDTIQYNNEVLGNKEAIASESIGTQEVVDTAKSLYNFVNEK